MQIQLDKPHRHAGRDWPIGATLNLPERKAAWLIGLGVAHAAAGAAAPKPADKRAKE